VEFEAIFSFKRASIDISPDWIEREQMPLPPSPRLAPSRRHVTFLEFTTLENPKMHSACGLQRPPIRFLGGDEVALDVQMHAPPVRATAWRIILFYFFFSPPRDCLDGGSEAYKKAKRQAELPDQTTISPDLSVRADCKHAPTLAGFYSSQLSRRIVSSHEWRGTRRRIYPEFYLTPMEKVEANGLTFYVFEAQGPYATRSGDGRPLQLA